MKPHIKMKKTRITKEVLTQRVNSVINEEMDKPEFIEITGPPIKQIPLMQTRDELILTVSEQPLIVDSLIVKNKVTSADLLNAYESSMKTLIDKHKDSSAKHVYTKMYAETAAPLRNLCAHMARIFPDGSYANMSTDSLLLFILARLSIVNSSTDISEVWRLYFSPYISAYVKSDEETI